MTTANDSTTSRHAIPFHSLGALLMLWCLTVSLSASAAVRYVDANSPNPVPPFTSWQTAAREIQRAVDLSSAGDEILVTNGVYSSGISRPAQGSTLTNRVCLDKAVTLRSVNGPLVTIIEGYQTTPRWADSSVAVRCAYVGSGAILEGFTLTKGDTRNEGPWISDANGGGVFCQSPNSLVRRCIIQGNVAYGEGGGAFGGRLENCLIIRNSATNGASGGCSNILVNCTVTRNALGNSPGGVRASIVYNSIVWENFGNPPNHSDTVFQYSCTEPLPSGGSGNISADPLFQLTHTNDFHLRSDSPCLEKGDNALAAGPTDLDGNPRQAGARVDMGAYEFASVPPRVTTEPNDQLAVLGPSRLCSASQWLAAGRCGTSGGSEQSLCCGRPTRACCSRTCKLRKRVDTASQSPTSSGGPTRALLFLRSLSL